MRQIISEAESIYKMIVEVAHRDPSFRLDIIASAEPDSVATFNILHRLLSQDHVKFSLNIVSNYDEFDRDLYTLSRHSNARIILLINIGAQINLVQKRVQFWPDPENQPEFWVFDYHRPIELHNYHTSEGVFVVLGAMDASISPPPAGNDEEADMFDDDDDEGEESSADDSSNSNNEDDANSEMDSFIAADDDKEVLEAERQQRDGVAEDHNDDDEDEGQMFLNEGEDKNEDSQVKRKRLRRIREANAQPMANDNADDTFVDPNLQYAADDEDGDSNNYGARRRRSIDVDPGENSFANDAERLTVDDVDGFATEEIYDEEEGIEIIDESLLHTRAAAALDNDPDDIVAQFDRSRAYLALAEEGGMDGDERLAYELELRERAEREAKRARRKARKERRARMEYYKTNQCSEPSAVLAHSLAFFLDKRSIDTIWPACVALAHHYHQGLLRGSESDAVTELLWENIEKERRGRKQSRGRVTGGGRGTSQQQVNGMRTANELSLLEDSLGIPLLRQTSLLESLMASPMFASELTLRAEEEDLQSELEVFRGHLGIEKALFDAARFNELPLSFTSNLNTLLRSAIDRLGILPEVIFRESQFVLHLPHVPIDKASVRSESYSFCVHPDLTALDASLAVSALLERPHTLAAELVPQISADNDENEVVGRRLVNVNGQPIDAYESALQEFDFDANSNNIASVAQSLPRKLMNEHDEEEYVTPSDNSFNTSSTEDTVNTHVSLKVRVARAFQTALSVFSTSSIHRRNISLGVDLYIKSTAQVAEQMARIRRQPCRFVSLAGRLILLIELMDLPSLRAPNIMREIGRRALFWHAIKGDANNILSVNRVRLPNQEAIVAVVPSSSRAAIDDSEFSNAYILAMQYEISPRAGAYTAQTLRDALEDQTIAYRQPSVDPFLIAVAPTAWKEFLNGKIVNQADIKRRVASAAKDKLRKEEEQEEEKELVGDGA